MYFHKSYVGFFSEFIEKLIIDVNKLQFLQK